MAEEHADPGQVEGEGRGRQRETSPSSGPPETRAGQVGL